MKQRTLAVMATGCGKTVLFAFLIRYWIERGLGRILVMAHREELIFQAADKIEQITGEAPEIEMANSRADQDMFHAKRPCVVTSVQTMSRVGRHSRFDPNDFTLLIIDEAHHSTANSYRRVIDYFSQNESLRILGVTATPDRHDEQALGQIYNTVSYEYGIQDAIEAGWLVPIDQQFVFVEGIDLSAVRTTAGDLNEGDLATIMEEEKNLHGVVGPTIELAGDSPVLFFTSSVRHADKVAEICNRHRPDSAIFLSGTTPKDERREKLRAFARGDHQYLCNCGLFLEGFDETRIGVVAVARPTKSRSLYSQMVGRGCRTLPGLVDGLPDAEDRKRVISSSRKPSLLVLDFVGNSGRHKLITTADALGGKYTDDVIEYAEAEARKKSARGEKSDMLVELAAAQEAVREAEKRRRASVIAKANYKKQSIDPFDVFDMTARREPGWHKARKPTEKMLAALRKFRIPERDIGSLSFVKAGQLLDKLIGRMKQDKCSYRQATTLRKYGYSVDATFGEASTLIDGLAKNGWKRAEAVAS